MMRKLFLMILLSVFSTSVALAQGNAVYKFKGKIGGKYAIVMELNATASWAGGSYYYVSQGSKKKLEVSGEPDYDNPEGARWILKEEVNGRYNGVFFLKWDRFSEYSRDGAMHITGTYINVKKQQFSVKLDAYDAYHYHGGRE